MATNKILCIIGKDYEDLELCYPVLRMIEAGYEVITCGEEAGATYLGKHGYPWKADVHIDEPNAEQFDGIIVPGGWMPDRLRRYDSVKKLLQDFDAQGKCIASICHGPWINISAGVVKGRTYTSTPGIKDDLVNAGATWVDQSVVIDEHHVSSRRPDDLPDFCKAMLQVLGR